MAPGQRVTVTVPNFYFQDGSVRFLKHTIKVYNVTERESGLIFQASRVEWRSTSSGTSSPSGMATSKFPANLILAAFRFGSKSNRSHRPAESSNAQVIEPTFELIDESNGKTTVLEPAGPMKESMETMKKAWKDASSTPEGTKQ